MVSKYFPPKQKKLVTSQCLKDASEITGSSTAQNDFRRPLNHFRTALGETKNPSTPLDGEKGDPLAPSGEN